MLGTVHDAHDCQKHGKLTRASAKRNPQGMAEGRPAPAMAYAFICDETESDGDPDAL